MLKTISKIVFAIALLYWLFIQGKLDFNLILKSFQFPKYLILGSVFLSLQIILSSFRLALLLKIKSNELKIFSLISIQWIGQMFSMVLPGAVTGDIVKISYIKKLDSKLSKSFIVFVVLVDRVIGLSSLLFFAGLTSLIFFDQLIALNPLMEKIIFINIALFFVSLLGISFIFVKTNHQKYLLKLIPFKRLQVLTTEVWKLRDHYKTFFHAYLISFAAHVFALLSFWAVNSPFFEEKIKVVYLASLVPLGHLAVAIPISPGGIGVGHAAFSSLFGFLGHTNGASLYNVYWVMLLIVSLFGVFPFILRKQK